MVEAAPRLAADTPRLAITHQTGERDLEMVRDGYRRARLEARVEPFLFEMDREMKAADLVVCRAGATTLSELTVCKKPSILVPFPAAADNHQVVNARSLADVGAAVMIEEKDLTGELLAAEVRSILAHPERREQMSRAAGRLGSPQAAKEIADVLADLVNRRWGTPYGRARDAGRAGANPTKPA
jgi:UDP-N-acetylglucosamine--N-acetylmuramyl-(pentapeptide) pyrophosphoryl-undecaprenol N-acetylglucosamine transferase